MFYAAILASAAILSSIPKAQAQQWQVCNHTPYAVAAAIGYAAQRGELKSEGWFNLGPCSGCAVVLLPEETTDRSAGYLWAKARNGPVLVEGPEPLCVNMRGNFKILGTRNCEGRNFQTRNFQRRDIDMRKDWTTHIRGDRQCNQ